MGSFVALHYQLDFRNFCFTLQRTFGPQVAGMDRCRRNACCLVIHTATLLGLLWSKAIWPTTFVSDILSVVAWGSMVGVQAFPERLLSLVNTSFVRLFAILLLGLSLIISQRQVLAGEVVSEQNWLYHVLLGSHIIILLAGYVMLGVACVASIIFLYQEHHLKTKLMTSIMIRFPALGTLDRLSSQGPFGGFGIEHWNYARNSN